MAEHADDADDADAADEGDDREGIESGPGEPTTERTTAPQSDYTGRDVAVGALVALVGILVTFVVPLLLV